MCRKHWEMVSPELQADVYAQYNKGQSVTKRPSKRWLLAAARARREVAIQEHRTGAVEFLSGIISALEALPGNEHVP